MRWWLFREDTHHRDWKKGFARDYTSRDGFIEYVIASLRAEGMDEGLGNLFLRGLLRSSQ